MWNDGMTPPLLAEANQPGSSCSSESTSFDHRAERRGPRKPKMPVTCHRSMGFFRRNSWDDLMNIPFIPHYIYIYIIQYSIKIGDSTG
jgi:hypothetical protein